MTKEKGFTCSLCKDHIVDEMNGDYFRSGSPFKEEVHCCQRCYRRCKQRMLAAQFRSDLLEEHGITLNYESL